ncbi:hypothetical protein D3C81_2015430 [compost metagenome]
MLGKYGNHYGNTDAAISRFTDAYHEARNEHLLIIFGEGTTEGRHAPQHGHQGQALDPAETVGKQ